MLDGYDGDVGVAGDTTCSFETVKGVDWGLLILLPDLDHFLYWYIKDGKHFLQANGRTYGPCDCIAYPSMSAEGSTFGFKFNVGGKGGKFTVTGGEWYVRIVDITSETGGRVYGPFERVEETWPCLSADGKTFAFRFPWDGRWYVQVNDWAYGSYDLVPFLQLSRDGGHFLFAYRRNGEWFVGDEGRTEGEFDDVYAARPDCSLPETVSLDQARFAYRKGADYFVRLSGKDYGPYEGLNPHSLAFSGDGTAFVFWYTAGEQVFFQTESRKYGGFQAAGPYSGFGGSGNSPYIGYKDVGSWYYRFGEELFGPYDFLWGRPAFSRDGKAFGFVYKKGDRFFVHVGGRDYGDFDRVDGLCISADGARHAFAFGNGGARHVQVDGNVYGPYDFAAVDAVFQNTFSPGGESYCFYYTKDGQHFIRFNDAEYGPFEYALNPQMSPNGKSVAVIHNVGGKEGYEKITGGRWYVQINDKTYDCGDEVAFRYGHGGRVAVMAYRSDGVILVKKIEL